MAVFTAKPLWILYFLCSFQLILVSSPWLYWSCSFKVCQWPLHYQTLWLWHFCKHLINLPWNSLHYWFLGEYTNKQVFLLDLWSFFLCLFLWFFFLYAISYLFTGKQSFQTLHNSFQRFQLWSPGEWAGSLHFYPLQVDGLESWPVYSQMRVLLVTPNLQFKNKTINFPLYGFHISVNVSRVPH